MAGTLATASRGIPAGDDLTERIVVFATGGTIASVHDPDAGGLRPARTSAELLAALPAEGVAELQVVELANSSSTYFTPAQVFEWARVVAEVLEDPEVTGAVVTHGTDTLEESAYLFDLTIDSGKPVVFTGAMRPASDLLSDGPRNVQCACLIAASPLARELGVLVVMAEQAHAAADVTKTHPASLGAFVSPGTGPMAGISTDAGGDRIELYRRPAGREHIETSQIVTEVGYVATVLGADSHPIHAVVANGARGLVIEAFGGGEVTPYMSDGIVAARSQGVEIVVATRCSSGRPLDRYADVGEGRWLRQHGVRFAGTITGPKARVKLMLALGNGTPKCLDESFPD